MKQKILVLVFGFSLLLFMYLGTRFAFRSRATGINLAMKMKLQGSYQTENKLNMRIEVYSGTTKVASFPNAQVTYSGNGYFEGLVMLTQDFDLAKPYALFIKPDKYLGQLFCSAAKTGPDCQYPEFIFKAGLNQLDIRDKVFYAGDLAPADGKVDSGDISKIFAAIGKTNAAVDINNDGIVNGIDYNLAQKTLSLNKTDDILSLQALPTAAPSPSPTIANSPTPTPMATVTIAPTTATTNQPSPTSPPTSNKGKCNAVLSGQVKVNYLGQAECRVLNETTHYCVNTQAECNNTTCASKIKTEIKAGVIQCGMGMASFDESSPINCQTSFVSDSSCIDPPADTTCEDDGSPECPGT